MEPQLLSVMRRSWRVSLLSYTFFPRPQPSERPRQNFHRKQGLLAGILKEPQRGCQDPWGIFTLQTEQKVHGV